MEQKEAPRARAKLQAKVSLAVLGVREIMKGNDMPEPINYYLKHAHAAVDLTVAVLEKLAVGKSTLKRGHEAVALQYMQDAARGTSFSVAGDDGDSKQYSVKWTITERRR